MNNTNKIILDLCGGTGSWSKPYKDAGYNVWNVTLPEWDIKRWFTGREFDIKPLEVYGILAAPPCTMFSDARTNAKSPRNLREGMGLVNRCLEIIQFYQYQVSSDQTKISPLRFWALENPWYGRLKWFIGNPVFVFDPWEFGDQYKKKTALWGYFNFPIKNYSKIGQVLTEEQIEKHKTNSQKLSKFDRLATKDIHPEAYGKFDRQARRAITPTGFAKAFYESNK